MHRITDPAELAACRRFYIPAACREVAQRCASKIGDAEAFTWQERGTLYAVAFWGRSQKPYSGSSTGQGSVYRFKSSETRRAWITELFRRASDHAQRRTREKSERTEKRLKPHALTVGDILRSTWGYDQTNVDHYQVTKLCGLTMVELRPIAGHSDESGWMQGDTVPAPGAYTGPAKRYRVSDYGDRDSVRIASYAIASKLYPVEVGGIRVYKPARWSSYA